MTFFSPTHPYTTLTVNAARFAAECMGFLARPLTMLPTPLSLV